MAALVTKIVPGRGRAGDSIDLIGTGFSPTSNSVLIEGVVAAVTFDSATLVTCTIPGGVPVDEHLEVVVTNDDDGTKFTWWVWSKLSTAALATATLPSKVPGHQEALKFLTISNMRYAESKYFERIASVIELLPNDLVNVKGALATMGAGGLRQVAPGLLGEPLVNAPTGAFFQSGGRATWSLQWGREIPAATTLILMEAGGQDTLTAVNGTAEVAPVAATVAMVSVYNRLSSGSSRITLVELLVEGVVVASGSGNITTFQQITFFPGVAVAQGDAVEIRLTKSSAVSAINARAVVQLV